MNKFLLVLLASLSFLSHGQEFKIDTSKVDQLLRASHSKNRFNGMALIAYKNRVVFQQAYGYSNIENQSTFTDSTKFQIASLSKQFTSFGILILEQENKLRIDEVVAVYLPDFPYANIKIRHLMSHTSGLPNFVNTMWKDLDTTIVNGNKEMINMLKSGKYPLQWEPGDKFEYSDIGYCVLATLIEKVSGINFKDFMAKKLFEPANMKNTSAEFVTDHRLIKASNLSMGYVYDSTSNKMEIAYNVPTNNFVSWLGGFYGDGSVVSTIGDLLKWDKALYEGKVIKPENIEKAMSVTVLNNGSNAEAWGASYGLGWLLYDSSNFGKVQTHSGGQPGYSSRLTRCPDKQLTIILLSNMSIPEFWKLNLLNELERQQ